MDFGGISSMIFNYVSNMNLNRLQVDIAVHGEEDAVRDDDLRKLGCKIYHLPIKSKNFLAWRKAYIDLFKCNHYDIVHANADAGNGPLLKLAAPYVPIRISHSHNTDYLTQSKVRRVLNSFQKNQIKKYATNLFACSNSAGKWLYGNNADFDVIHNAIDYQKYSFNQDIRADVRQELGISDKEVVIGHVGRFEHQKNHDFLIRVFNELVKEMGGVSPFTSWRWFAALGY